MPSFKRAQKAYLPTSKQSRNAPPVRSNKRVVTGRARHKRISAGSAVKGAENKLKNFRQASILAVALTGFIMLLFAPGEAGLAQNENMAQIENADTLSATEITTNVKSLSPEADSTAVLSSKEATDEALGAINNLWNSFFYNLPKISIALVTILLAWIAVWLLKKILQKLIGRWTNSNAVISLVSIGVWLLAIGVALSVIARDIRALIGSLGLIGLALSWSLQTPIESFTGWLLNSFKGYYHVGDRIRVGDVFGDVYRIDFPTTTVWEIGSPYQAGFVNAEQPTGRMVTFPNNEILTGTVTNLTGDFPFVWDELAVSVANESNLLLSVQVLEKIAVELLGDYMVEPAQAYAQLLQKARFQEYISDKPQVYVSTEDSWTNLTIRYLVGARERRKWKSELNILVSQELSKPGYVGKIIPVYPRQQVQLISPAGMPIEVIPNQDKKDESKQNGTKPA